MRSSAVLLLLVLVGIFSESYAAAPPKMRPYSGIGVVALPGASTEPDQKEPVYLYEEPGIFRSGMLADSDRTGNEWVFGTQANVRLLIVLARRGEWLKVCYDDAGREAWIELRRNGAFKPWDRFFKEQVSRLLPGLRKQYYQMYRQPDRSPVVTLTPKQLFKVLKLENDWAMVMSDQNTIGWLRWRDEDGRLLLGSGAEIKP